MKLWGLLDVVVVGEHPSSWNFCQDFCEGCRAPQDHLNYWMISNILLKFKEKKGRPSWRWDLVSMPLQWIRRTFSLFHQGFELQVYIMSLCALGWLYYFSFYIGNPIFTWCAIRIAWILTPFRVVQLDLHSSEPFNYAISLNKYKIVSRIFTLPSSWHS